MNRVASENVKRYPAMTLCENHCQVRSGRAVLNRGSGACDCICVTPHHVCRRAGSRPVDRPWIRSGADPGDLTDAGGDDGTAAPPDVVTERAPEVAGGSGGPPPTARPVRSTAPPARSERPQQRSRSQRPHPGGLRIPAERYQAGAELPVLALPILRIPTPQEYAAPGGRPASACFTTFEIPIIGLGDILAALSQPKPKPVPSPAFRSRAGSARHGRHPGPDGGGGGAITAAADGRRSAFGCRCCSRRGCRDVAPRRGPVATPAGPPARRRRWTPPSPPARGPR